MQVDTGATCEDTKNLKCRSERFMVHICSHMHNSGKCHSCCVHAIFFECHTVMITLWFHTQSSLRADQKHLQVHVKYMWTDFLQLKPVRDGEPSGCGPDVFTCKCWSRLGLRAVWASRCPATDLTDIRGKVGRLKSITRQGRWVEISLMMSNLSKPCTASVDSENHDFN